MLMGPSVFGGVCFGFEHGLLARRISTRIHCEKLHLNCAFHCTSALHYTDMGNRGCGCERGPSPRGSSQPPHRPPARVVCSAGKSPPLVAQLAGVASNPPLLRFHGPLVVPCPAVPAVSPSPLQSSDPGRPVIPPLHLHLRLRYTSTSVTPPLQHHNIIA